MRYNMKEAVMPLTTPEYKLSAFTKELYAAMEAVTHARMVETPEIIARKNPNDFAIRFKFNKMVLSDLYDKISAEMATILTQRLDMPALDDINIFDVRRPDTNEVILLFNTDDCIVLDDVGMVQQDW